MYAEITLIAYAIDHIAGEFRAIRHPVVLMGDYIIWFERHFYRDSILQGALLVLSLTAITLLLSLALQTLLAYDGDSFLLSACCALISALIASTAIAARMLHDSVKRIITYPNEIRYLVSRDTHALTPSQIHKAAIETYAENLSDGVIAPLFYLLIFGLPGAFVYKAINTLDSMVGYRNARYEKFGKCAAKLDDFANFIPARLTALLILLLGGGIDGFWQRWRMVLTQGSRHDSPNAGYPMAAMGCVLQLKLGGSAYYFGKRKEKPIFGCGREDVTAEDIRLALALQPRLDMALMLFLVSLWLYKGFL